MDRGTARNLVQLKAEDKDGTQNTPEEYNEAIDLAEEQFAIETRALFDSATLTVVADQAFVALPTNFLVGILVRHKGLKLRPTNEYDLSFQTGDDWRALKGTPTAFWINEKEERIELVPRPQTTDAGDNLDLRFAAVPTALTGDSSILLDARAFMAYYHPGIVSWAAWGVLGYQTMSPEVGAKRATLIDEGKCYKEKAIEVYKNLANKPPQMKGGRNWTDTAGGPGKCVL